MGFKSIEKIVLTPLFLNGLQKYWDHNRVFILGLKWASTVYRYDKNLTVIPMEKIYFRFWLQYLLLWYIALETIQLALDHLHQKKIFSFLAKVVLWCIWLGKNVIGLDSYQKKYIFVLTTILLWCMGLIYFSIDTWPPPKKNITVFGYTTNMKHETLKISIGNQPPTN